MTSTSVDGTEVAAPPTPGARGRLLARNLAVTAVVGTVALEIVSAFVEPSLPNDPAPLLAALAAHPVRSVVGVASFLLAEVAGIGAALGIAHLLRHRSPRLGVVGAFLIVLGGVSDAVSGAVSLVTLAMSTDPGNRAVFAALLNRVHQQPALGCF